MQGSVELRGATRRSGVEGSKDRDGQAREQHQFHFVGNKGCCRLESRSEAERQ